MTVITRRNALLGATAAVAVAGAHGMATRKNRSLPRADNAASVVPGSLPTPGYYTFLS